MTFVPPTAATSGAMAASAAAKHQQEMQAEEELMTKYNADEIDPYRTLVGMSMDKLGFLIAASVLVGLGALFGMVFWLTNVAK